MAQDFYTELMEALKEQKEREVEEFYNKLDDGELPGIPMNIINVTKTFYRVALKHKVTKEELAMVLSATEPTKQDLENFKAFSEE